MTGSVAGRLTGAVLLVSLVLTACAPAPASPTAAAPPEETVSVLPAGDGAAQQPPELRGSSIERVARQVTVRVRARGCGRLGTASAVAVAPRLLVTNRHVVQGAEEIELNYWDGTSARARLTELAVADDLALVRVSSRLPAVAPIAASDAGEDTAVMVVGYPSGGEQKIARGRVVEYARLREPNGASPVMRMTTRIVPGNSGGAVVDGAGELVGVVFGVETDTGHGLAVPASAVTELLDAGGAPGTVQCG